jgi:methyl-accepting chemotaxis protein
LLNDVSNALGQARARGTAMHVTRSESSADQLQLSTQQNAALVEQSSAAATSLSDQVQRLLSTVQAVKLH